MTKKVIRVQTLSKRYRLGLKEKQAETLAGQIGNIIKSPLVNLKRLREINKFGTEDDSVFWALKNVSFEVKEGEVLGIIGKNGAGKSTLLKILSQITEPTSGKIEIQGRVASLLEVGTGFHPELSGRENIFMNGTILGMTRKEIDSKLDEIIDFSGVEKFIDTPVKFYSSGMKVRLGFSVAAHLDPEILIIDEVLSVGDYEFQAKCLGKMEEVSKSQGRTVLFVSHNMGAVSSLCSRLICLKNGKVSYEGEVLNGIQSYLDSSEILDHSEGENTSGFNIELFNIFSEGKTDSNVIPHDSDIIVDLKFSTIKNKNNINLSYMLFNEESERISTIHINDLEINNGIGEIKILISGNTLIPNNYYFNFQINDGFDVLFTNNRIANFSVFDNGSPFFKWKPKDVGRLFLNYKVIN